MTKAEAIRKLRIGPNAFRRLSSAFETLLGPMPESGLSSEQLSMMEAIVALQDKGLSEEAILETLAGPQTPFRAEAAATAAPPGHLEETLAAISEEISRAEERRMEDRDRLLTALVRTQQELAQLRQEVGLSRSRRERRRGFLARLFTR